MILLLSIFRTLSLFMERVLFVILTCDLVPKPEEPPYIRDMGKQCYKFWIFEFYFYHSNLRFLYLESSNKDVEWYNIVLDAALLTSWSCFKLRDFKISKYSLLIGILNESRPLPGIECSELRLVVSKSVKILELIGLSNPLSNPLSARIFTDFGLSC